MNNTNNDEYEKVPVDVWLDATIVEIKRDENHETTFQGQTTMKDCIRFKFDIDGCEMPHYSRWLTFSYSAKANLYKRYITKLVAGCSEYFDFDIESLKGMKIKLMYSETTKDGKTFQNVEMVRPQGEKVNFDFTRSDIVQDAPPIETEIQNSEPLPFDDAPPPEYRGE